MTYPWLAEAEQQFSQSLGEGRLAHASLVSGPRGLGKLAFASRAAQSLLCLENPAGESRAGEDGLQRTCTCRSCQLMSSGAHPDFRLLTFEENEKTHKMRTELVIDQVRRLTASMQLTNSLSPYKVALIHPAEAMNRSTANALLKTLEEPPGDAVLFLVSHDPARLSATIRSRCQSIHVRVPDRAVAQSWLMEQGVEDSSVAARALEASAGSPLIALEMIEDGRAEQCQAVENLLNRVLCDESAIGDVMDNCAKMEPEDLWAWISLSTARRVRDGLGVRRGEESAAKSSSPASGTRQVSALVNLQSLADRNRLAMSSQLRKDLLLRDWLIQWSRSSSDHN